MDLEVRVYCHTSLHVQHVVMLANGFYMHYGFIHAFHSIVVVVTYLIDVR